MLNALKNNQQLKKLDLSNNDFSNYSSFSAIEHFLQTNKCLEDLKLNSCRIEKQGAKMIGKGLKKNFALKKLYLSGNQIGGAGLEDICDGVCENLLSSALI